MYLNLKKHTPEENELRYTPFFSHSSFNKLIKKKCLKLFN